MTEKVNVVTLGSRKTPRPRTEQAQKIEQQQREILAILGGNDEDAALLGQLLGK